MSGGKVAGKIEGSSLRARFGTEVGYSDGISCGKASVKLEGTAG